MPRRRKGASPPSTPAPDHLDGYRPEPETATSDERLIAEARAAARWDDAALDGYRNELSGIGDWNRDKTLGGMPGGLPFDVRFLSGVDVENRWRGSDLGGRIVETKPHEMTRAGWDVTVQPAPGDLEPSPPSARLDAFPTVQPEPEGPQLPRAGRPLPDLNDEGAAEVAALEARLRELEAASAIYEALCYEVAYGGGGVLIGADDGVADLTRPLDEASIKSIRSLTAFRGGWDGELVAWRYYNDPRRPDYGKPEIYQLRNLGVPLSAPPAPGETAPPRPLPTSATGSLLFYVHESRILVFPGTAVSRRARVQMRGWGDSVFTRVDEVLSDYDQAWGGIAILLQEFSIATMKMEGLAEAMASTDPKKQGVLQRRALALQLSQSIARMRILDAREEFDRVNATLSGLPETMQQFALRLAAAADMPVTLLMGQAPGGLNATGASDVRFFYDRIAALQQSKLVPQLRRLIRLMFLSHDGPTKGVEPARWDVTMRPLWQPTEAETVEMRLKQAQADEIYMRSQALSPEEVTASRFAGSKYSIETVLDLDGRRTTAALGEAEAEETAERARRRAAAETGRPTVPSPPEPSTPASPRVLPGGGGVASGG